MGSGAWRILNLAPASLKPCPSASLGGPPWSLPEMGTASSVPPGNQAPPTPSRPLGLRAAPASSAPPRPQSWSFRPLGRPRSGPPVSQPQIQDPSCPLGGNPAPPQPCPGSSLPALPTILPLSGPCPTPTAARKDAAWVPCQGCECAAPPSRARNAAGPRGRPQTPGSGQAQRCSQAGRWPRLARTWIASRWKASCLPLKILPSLH